MIGADSGQALSTALIAWLLWRDQLAVWQLYTAAALSAIFGAFSGPAYGASIPLLVPKEQLVRSKALAARDRDVDCAERDRLCDGWPLALAQVAGWVC